MLKAGAATWRWILQQLRSKTVLAPIGAFPNKYTLKTPFSHNGYIRSLEFYENYHFVLSGQNKLFDNNDMLAQNHAWHITQSG